MSWSRRLWNVFRGERVSAEMTREMAFHMEERADALVAQGYTREQAEREARRRFGNEVALRERTRDADLLGWLDTLFADVRYAWRSMRATPAFAAVAVLSLALGIGANTAIFSLMNAVMLRALPVHEPQELLQVNLGGEGDVSLTNPIWEALRDREDVFDGVFAYGGGRFNLSERGEERPVEGVYVSGAYFSTLGVRPAAGRLLTEADDVRGCAGAVVLGHGFWQSEFGGDDVVGRTIALSGRRFPIVGVADASFFGVEVGRSMQVYLPLCAEAVIAGSGSILDARSTWWLTLIGRPLPGLTRERVDARLATLAPSVFEATVPERYSQESKAEYAENSLGVIPAATGLSELRNAYSRALVVLMVIVAAVLLVACANVANLLLARATTRQREVAVRLAIGAGRARLVRQLLTESLLLSVLGAVLGVLFARWGSSLLVRFLSTRGSPVWLDLSIDGRVLLFTIVVATATGVLFGLAPAWRSSRVQPQAVLRGQSRGVVQGHSRISVGKILVSAQLALSLVLVMGAALLVGSFQRLASMDAGFRRDGLLITNVNMRNAGITADMQYDTYRSLLQQARALPGVRHASVASVVPVSGSSWNDVIVVDGFEAAELTDALSWMNEVSDGYFETFGTAFIAGRDFSATERPGSPRVAIVNQSFAQHYFGTVDVVGRQFRTEITDAVSEPWEIIGVVRDARYRGLRETDERLAYLPLNRNETPGNALSIVLHADGDVNALVPAFKQMIGAAVPAASLRFTRWDRQLAQSITRERLLATLSGFFGALALLLAMIGLYGIMSYNVARRRPEIGIRLAIGWGRADVLRMVLREVGWMVLAGVVVGLGGVAAATRLISTFLFGLRATEPSMLLLSTVILAGVALVAGGIPAWRAARLDPMEALRAD